MLDKLGKRYTEGGGIWRGYLDLPLWISHLRRSQSFSRLHQTLVSEVAETAAAAASPKFALVPCETPDLVLLFSSWPIWIPPLYTLVLVTSAHFLMTLAGWLYLSL